MPEMKLTPTCAVRDAFGEPVVESGSPPYGYLDHHNGPSAERRAVGMQHRTAKSGSQRVFIGSPQIYVPTTNTAGVG